MTGFEFHRPDTVAAAKALLIARPEARLMAGGMTLLPTVKQRLAAPSDLVDLGRLASLRAIGEEGGALVIGAMANHDAVARSSLVRARIPALATLAGGIGDPQVRNRGTLGGSIANNDPAADYPAALLALEATIETDARSIAAGAFFTGLFETALAPDEIVTAVRVPVPLAAAYVKFRSPASRYALVGVFVARSSDGARVAVTGAGPGVFRVPAFEAALDEAFDPVSLAGLAVPAEGLVSDIHGSAAYRASLIRVLAERAVAEAV